MGGMRAGLLILLSGCGAVTSTDPLASLTQVDPPRADEARRVALAAYEDETDAPMPDVPVQWVAERIPFEDATVIGVQRDCEVWATWSPGVPFHHLALAHEIGHCACLLATGDGDETHADAARWGEGGTVARVNLRLLAAGF